MLKFELNSALPKYIQIVKALRLQIIDGKLSPNQKILSVRGMAAQLNVNKNTVLKAYSILQQDGFIYCVKGKGEYVTENLDLLKQQKKSDVISALKTATKQAKEAGMWIDEIFTVVDESYSS